MSFTLPFSCTIIGPSAFDGSGLTSMSIQGNMTQIDTTAFTNTSPSLQFYVVYNSTVPLLLAAGINQANITVLSPVINTIQPNSGPINVSTPVTITGSNFTNDTTVSFQTNAGVLAASVTSVSNDGTTLNFTTPILSNPEQVDIIVSTTGGESTTVTDGYTYISTDPPTISTINPSQGSISGGTSVTITGSNFVFSGTTVTFGGISATSVTVTNTGSLTCTTPAGTIPEAVDVEVSTTYGNDTLIGGYTYTNANYPTISSINPSQGSKLGGTIVTITGSNFVVSGTTVTFGGISATSVTVTNTGSLTCTTPAVQNTGSVNVIVTTINGSATVINGYLYTLTPCFLKGTKILTNYGYVPIEKLNKNYLIKTLNHNFVPIDMIGESTIYNPDSQERIKERLYKCSKDNYPNLFEDLVITGLHSILIDEFKDRIQSEKNRKTLNGVNYMTEGKYRLFACVDENTLPYEKEGYFTVYSITLDNENDHVNYGIYANGLLVESTTKAALIKYTKIILE